MRSSGQRQCMPLALCFVAKDAFLWPPGQPYEAEDGAAAVIPFTDKETEEACLVPFGSLQGSCHSFLPFRLSFW